jgi:hypothetical protein
MTRLRDPSTLTELPPQSDGIELPPLREPESLDDTPTNLFSNGPMVMTAEEISSDASGAIPSSPGSDRFGDRTSHIMTGRFVITGSTDAYRIWKFQSPDPMMEFPSTEQGWTQAWAAFRELAVQAA